MTFWTYMLHCRGGYFYTGHTDNLEYRVAQHERGVIAGFSRDHHPVQLVWSAEFSSRVEALEAERRIKGWSRAKKLALIREDWDKISFLAQNRQGKDDPSTSSGRTDILDAPPRKNSVRAEHRGKDDPSTSSGRTDVLDAPPRKSSFRAELVEALSLRPHPDTSCAAVTAISVEVLQPAADQLALRYTVTGDISALFVPPRKAPARINDLWKTTCFEVFIRPEGGTAYHEYNFSPDTRWAAFAFEGHRTNSRNLQVPRAPEIVMAQTATTLIADCLVHLPQPYSLACALGLSMVVEAMDGVKSYWALRHPPSAPDFHDANCFTATLPAFDAG